jgi:hypothetical protein
MMCALSWACKWGLQDTHKPLRSTLITFYNSAFQNAAYERLDDKRLGSKQLGLGLYATSEAASAGLRRDVKSMAAR